MKSDQAACASFTHDADICHFTTLDMLDRSQLSKPHTQSSSYTIRAGYHLVISCTRTRIKVTSLWNATAIFHVECCNWIAWWKIATETADWEIIEDAEVDGVEIIAGWAAGHREFVVIGLQTKRKTCFYFYFENYVLLLLLYYCYLILNKTKTLNLVHDFAAVWP